MNLQSDQKQTTGSTLLNFVCSDAKDEFLIPKNYYLFIGITGFELPGCFARDTVIILDAEEIPKDTMITTDTK